MLDGWFCPLRPHLHCTTPALAGGARERSAVQVLDTSPKCDDENLGCEVSGYLVGFGGGLVTLLFLNTLQSSENRIKSKFLLPFPADRCCVVA